MRVLTTEDPGEPTLFEPFIEASVAEQLIYRRGEHLWNTPEGYIDTLCSAGEMTDSDVITVNARLWRGREDELFHTLVERATDTLRFVCICNSKEVAHMADRCGGVCAVAVYGDITAHKPTIRMDGTAEDALRMGCAGWFAPHDAENYWDEYSDRIAILGGLGEDYLTATGPVSIHRRCEKIYKITDNRRYALGSGGCIPDKQYLKFISMVGIYKQYRY